MSAAKSWRSSGKEGIDHVVQKRAGQAVEAAVQLILGRTLHGDRSAFLFTYKGKGIKYANETIRRKVGKTGAKK